MDRDPGLSPELHCLKYSYEQCRTTPVVGGRLSGLGLIPSRMLSGPRRFVQEFETTGISLTCPESSLYCLEDSAHSG